MKLLCSFLLGFVFSLNVQGQNCQKLDAQSFFTTIKFGGHIPQALARCAPRSTVGSGAPYSFLRLEYDSLQLSCRKQYADLFTFLSQPFSFSQISTNPKRQILTLELYSFFNEHKETASEDDGPLAGFYTLYKKMQSLYGTPTQLELPTKLDSLLMKERGMEQVAFWSCSTIDIRLRVYFGAPQKGINVLHVSIRNRDFDKPEEEQLLQ